MNERVPVPSNSGSVLPSCERVPAKGETVVATDALDEFMAAVSAYRGLAVALDDDEQAEFNAAEGKLAAAYQRVRASMVVGF